MYQATDTKKDTYRFPSFKDYQKKQSTDLHKLSLGSNLIRTNSKNQIGRPDVKNQIGSNLIRTDVKNQIGSKLGGTDVKNQIGSNLKKTNVMKEVQNDNNEEEEVFWIYNPGVLFESINIIPGLEMNNAERMNAMTRVIIIIAAIMYSIKFPAWWLFLIISLFVIVIIWFALKHHEMTISRQYLRSPRHRIMVPIDKPVFNLVSRPRK